MKKVFALLLPLTLLLTACGETVQTAEDIQTQYARLATADIAAKVTCHLGEETRTYELTCTVTQDGASTTVTAPEELAGITAIGEKILSEFEPKSEETEEDEGVQQDLLQPDDNPFVETATRAIDLSELKFGRNYKSEE